VACKVGKEMPPDLHDATYRQVLWLAEWSATELLRNDRDQCCKMYDGPQGMSVIHHFLLRNTKQFKGTMDRADAYAGRSPP
jgi:hypothetical protein